METGVFKVPQSKRHISESSDSEIWSPTKKKKINDKFLNFCDIVLAYTQYSSVRSQEMRQNSNRSPLDSGGSTADSFNSDSIYSFEEEPEEVTPTNNEMIADDTSFNDVTCFCGKPYMGRPMIECSVCYNWLHLSCVNLRKNNIPETFVCDDCKTADYKEPRKEFSADDKQVRRRPHMEGSQHTNRNSPVHTSGNKVSPNYSHSSYPRVTSLTRGSFVDQQNKTPPHEPRYDKKSP